MPPSRYLLFSVNKRLNGINELFVHHKIINFHIFINTEILYKVKLVSTLTENVVRLILSFFLNVI